MLLLHCTAELLCSRWPGDAGHHPALQAGETAQQLALPGLHHWCTAVLSAPREDLQRGVLCTAHLAPASRAQAFGRALKGPERGRWVPHEEAPQRHVSGRDSWSNRAA